MLATIHAQGAGALIDVGETARLAGYDCPVAVSALALAKVQAVSLRSEGNTNQRLLAVLTRGRLATRGDSTRVQDFDIHLPGSGETYTRFTMFRGPDGTLITLPGE
jgi:hypothetical protein